MTKLIWVSKSNLVLDERARDGTWCTRKYPNHPKGCPNFGKRDYCPPRAPKFEDIAAQPYYFLVEPFNLKAHAARMKAKHLHWTERQCRNLLYWQGTVRKRLREAAKEFIPYLELKHGFNFKVLEIPEANGVNMFATMENLGFPLEREQPNMIHKIVMLVSEPGVLT